MPISQSDPHLPKKLAVIVVTLAVAALFIGMIRGFLIALFLAAVFSAMAYPLFRRIDQAFGGRRGLAAGATLLLLISAVFLPGIAIMLVIAEQAQEIGKQAIPWVQQQLADPAAPGLQLPAWLPFHEQLQAWLPTIVTKLGELSSKIGQFAVQAVSSVSSGAAQFFLNLFVLLYAMFFFLSEAPELLATARRYAVMLGGVQERIFDRAVVVTRATVKGTLVIGIVQGVLGGIGFAMFGVDGAVFWGAVMAIASMLPVVGTSLIWIPAVIYLLATGDTTSAVGLGLWSALIVGNIDNILRPMLVGNDTEMSDLMVLISTFGGLSMFGASGLILGPVIAAVATTLIEIAYDTLRQPAVEAEPAASPQPAPAPAAAPSGGDTAPVTGGGLLEVSFTEAQKRELAALSDEMARAKSSKPQET